VAGFSGNASFDALRLHNGQQFTTIDRDNDRYSRGNCAVWSRGGFWWRVGCGECGVNGAGSTAGFYWYDLPGGRDLQLSRMWLQCK